MEPVVATGSQITGRACKNARLFIFTAASFLEQAQYIGNHLPVTIQAIPLLSVMPLSRPTRVLPSAALKIILSYLLPVLGLLLACERPEGNPAPTGPLISHH
jgi:hypothetical protein